MFWILPIVMAPDENAIAKGTKSLCHAIWETGTNNIQKYIIYYIKYIYYIKINIYNVFLYTLIHFEILYCYIIIYTVIYIIYILPSIQTSST